MKPTKKYSRLTQSEANILPTLHPEDGRPPDKINHNWTRTSAYFLLGILAAVSCGLFGYVLARQDAPAPAHDHAHPLSITAKPSTSTSELHCGNSSTEARSLGCVFDLLTNNWMPEYCSDRATDAEYREWVLDPSRRLGAWAFYHDSRAEHQVASEEALSDLVGSHVYTTTENHLGHCAFLARRMHRLITGEIAAVAHNTFSHTVHCTTAILEAVGKAEQPGGAQIGSTFDVGIVSCLVDGA
ncbi:hypothetical protein VM1G_06741 [Cytospora mali]|uniref:Uncharacterized protein n=1 Tax=Cytospora mali TaxID=578113 RepID=A0A194W463_CYTMA|nr:hypothetical protein VM1G_06741 [Valsa mali]